jgi:hypothetical protein
MPNARFPHELLAFGKEKVVRRVPSTLLNHHREIFVTLGLHRSGASLFEVAVARRCFWEQAQPVRASSHALCRI